MSHGHDDHHDDHHDEHETHGHDIHSDDGHSHDDHSGHHDDHGDHSGDDEEQYDEADEHDDAEKKYTKLIDIIQTTYGELKNLDMSVIQKPLPLAPYKNLFKKNTLDISSKEKKQINLALHPKIKILQLKKSIDSITFCKKPNNVFLDFPEIKKHIHSLYLQDLENISYVSGPFPDIIKPKRNIFKRVSRIFFHIKRSPKTFFKKFMSEKYCFDPKLFLKICLEKLSFFKKTKNLALFLLVLGLISFYGLFTKYYVEKTFHSLQTISLNGDFPTLQKQILDLKTSFIISKVLLQPLFIGNILFQNQDLANLEHATLGMSHGINYSIHLLTIYHGIHNLIEEKQPHEILYSELYKNILPRLFDANVELDKSIEKISFIQDLPNPELQKSLNEKLGLLHQVQKYSHLLYEKQDAILELLGDEKKKTYMFVFQNADEIRPTGGFMGSLAFVQLYKGKILNFEKKDIYALEWYIKETFDEPAPEGISSITKVFPLRDANFYPDIKQSSEKIKSFVDRTQYHIDGIVYINQNIIIDFLKKFGGLYYDTVKREVTAENFSMLISTLVETKVSKTHTLATPKQILFDFIDLYIPHLLNMGKYSSYIQTLFSSFEKKDIFAYSFDHDVNDFLGEFGMKSNDYMSYTDFNYPVFTSISANKSDRYMERQFFKNTQILPDCSISSTLTLKSYHRFTIAREIEIKNFLYDMDLLGRVDLENTLKTQGKGINKQYTRVLLPKNAIITKDKKQQIQEFDTHKEVSFYMDTNTLFPTEIDINYSLPNPTCEAYTYTFIKQPGIPEYKLSFLLNQVQLVDSFYSKDYILK